MNRIYSCLFVFGNQAKHMNQIPKLSKGFMKLLKIIYFVLIVPSNMNIKISK